MERELSNKTFGEKLQSRQNPNIVINHDSFYINSMQKQEQIKFYRPNQPYGFLSNFYPSPFAVGKTVYLTSEHYFQSKKYEGHPQQQLVIQAKTPKLAFSLGRRKSFPRRHDWEAVKENVMYEALRRKFYTHVELRDKLLQTGDSKLIEHTYNDSYWADGGDGKGKNRLGVLLMRLRSQLRKQQNKLKSSSEMKSQ